MKEVSPGLDAARLLPVLLGTALVSALLAAFVLFWAGRAAGEHAEARARLTALASLSQNMPLQAGAAARGSAPAFDALAASRAQLDATLAGGRGDPLAREAGWRAMLEQSQAVLDGRAASLKAQQAAADVRDFTPQLLAAASNVAKSLGGGMPDSLRRNFERFELRALAIEQDLGALADGTVPVETASHRLGESLEFMSQFVAGLSGEPNTLGIVRPGAVADEAARLLGGVFRGEAQLVRGTIALGEQLEQLQAARNALAETGTALYASVAKAEQAGAGATTGWLARPWLPLALIGIAALALALAWMMHASAASDRRAAEAATEQNERNQRAILRLLDEISNLADGDLTVQATVTEDITGTIADSINFAIEALRELVMTINGTAIRVEGTARQTQALSTHLAKSSVAQSRQIGAASESVTAMATSVEEVSGNAERSSDVARHSVDIAQKGVDAVRRTIDGMNAIRENIQETSKRIKRLGESSQEIGNIVELINDIAEQTNILALNASIQASMAGEAGRGFAVVADEVQRLAERAANSTRQIEVLVRTIQADTNEAVVSMERTTTDVVGGALLAENAGAALEEIEQVSNQIASLVQNISASARQQSTVAQSISRNMQVLREISSQTADSTSSTSSSIGRLAELSAQLRKSVSGFRLPDEAGTAVAPAGSAGPGGASGEYPELKSEPVPPSNATSGGTPLRRASGFSA
jgi:twitching motility protein PilJ